MRESGWKNDQSKTCEDTGKKCTPRIVATSSKDVDEENFRCSEQDTLGTEAQVPNPVSCLGNISQVHKVGDKS